MGAGGRVGTGIGVGDGCEMGVGDGSESGLGLGSGSGWVVTVVWAMCSSPRCNCAFPQDVRIININVMAVSNNVFFMAASFCCYSFL